MLDLWELTRDVARELRKGGLYSATSTASTTTTLTDATIPLIAGAVDGGTIWLHDESPHISRVISTLSAAGLVTFTPLVAALAGAQAYTIFGSVYNRSTLQDAVNRALLNLGEFAQYGTFDSTGLQEDYNILTLVPTANRIMTLEVSAYTDPSTADNPAWMMHYGWIQFGDTLRFLANPPIYDGTANIRIGWNIPHAELTTEADEIRREVSPIRLKWEAVQEAYMSLIGPRDSEVLDEQTTNLFNRAAQMAGKYPAHGNQPLPEPQLFLGVGSRGGAAVNPDLI